MNNLSTFLILVLATNLTFTYLVKLRRMNHDVKEPNERVKRFRIDIIPGNCITKQQCDIYIGSARLCRTVQICTQ